MLFWEIIFFPAKLGGKMFQFGGDDQTAVGYITVLGKVIGMVIFGGIEFVKFNNLSNRSFDFGNRSFG